MINREYFGYIDLFDVDFDDWEVVFAEPTYIDNSLDLLN